MKQLLALTLFTIVIVSACRQDIFLGSRFMDEPKRYIIFPVGSAWVYEDSGSLALDTVTVHSMGNGEMTTKGPVTDETVELVNCNYTYDTLLIGFSFFKDYGNDEYVEYNYGIPGGSVNKTLLRFIKGAQMRKINEGDFGYTAKWGLDTLKFGSLLLNNGSNGTIETLRYHVRRGNEVYGNYSILARYETTGWNDLENQFYHLVNLEKLDSYNNGFWSFDKTIKSIPNFDEVYFLSPDSVEYLFKELPFSKGIGISRFITQNNKVYSLIDYGIK